MKTKLEGYAISSEDLAQEAEYLIPELLVRETITMLYGKAGCGKSLVTLNIALYLLLNEKVDRIIYLDGDNSRMALKKRGIDKLIDIFPTERFLYIPSDKANNDLIKELHNEMNNSNEHALIIIDSIRNFMLGMDANSDRDAIKFMKSIQQIRDTGCTIIMLHHMNKQGKYKNSTSFLDYSDVAYELTSIKDIGSLQVQLRIEKDRLGCIEKAYVEVGFEGYILKVKRGTYDQEDAEIVECIIDFLRAGNANNSDLIEWVNACLGGVNRNKVSKIIGKYVDILWKFTKGPNNSKIYELIFDPYLVNFEYFPDNDDRQESIKPDKTDTTLQLQAIQAGKVVIYPIQPENTCSMYNISNIEQYVPSSPCNTRVVSESP